MTTQRRRNVSDDHLNITPRVTRSMARENGRENAFPMIPIDLTIDIFSRLPAKAIARSRCVSKPWASTLQRSDFKELFSTRSSSRPHFLFAFETNGELNFFSSPQPQNPDENSSSLASYHMKFSFVDYQSRIHHPVHGLVCHTNMRFSKGKEETVQEIYNPSTGQSLLLPKVKTSKVDVFTLLGYDPIDKQFKLLSMACSRIGVNNVFEDHQVLTLGTTTRRRNPSWRMIKCCRPHFCPSEQGICIDGVLYYTASEDTSSSQNSMLVCFDVRSEKFDFIQAPDTLDTNWSGIPVKYNGKLALLILSLVDPSTESFELCVLEENDGKHEWSKLTCVLSDLWRDVVGNKVLYIVGMTRMNEIVLVTHCQDVPFYVYYYNIERNTTVKIQIQGMEAFANKGLQVYLNHMENLKLM